MRYTKPEIQNESKATPLIMGTQAKITDLPELQVNKRSDPAAYEADE
jgi:hypothetical protein